MALSKELQPLCSANEVAALLQHDLSALMIDIEQTTGRQIGDKASLDSAVQKLCSISQMMRSGDLRKPCTRDPAPHLKHRHQRKQLDGMFKP